MNDQDPLSDSRVIVECQRCNGDHTLDMNRMSSYSLSRRDNKTPICNRCAEEESLIDWVITDQKILPNPESPYWTIWRRDANFQIALGDDVVLKYTKLIFHAIHGMTKFPVTDEVLHGFIKELGQISREGTGR